MLKILKVLLLSILTLLFIGCGSENKTNKEPISNADKIEVLNTTKNNSVNSTPIATFDSFRINRNSSYNGTLTATDPDGDELKYVIVEQPKHGTVVLHDNGCFTYTPNSGYKGIDTFSYRASDDVSSCGVKKVTIDVCQEPLQKPSTPKNLTATALSISSIKLNWTDTSDNEEGFVIYRDGKPIATTKADKTSKTICGLKENTTYTFVLKAKNLAGMSEPVTVNITTKEITSKPNAPTNLTAKNVAKTSLRLTWKDNSDNESSFEIYQDGIKIKTISSGCNCKIIDGLTEGTTYSFMVKAVNRLGSSDSESIIVKIEGEKYTSFEDFLNDVPENTIPNRIDIEIPPYPNKIENNSTITGIDLNKNNVRDDVENIIFQGLSNDLNVNKKDYIDILSVLSKLQPKNPPIKNSIDEHKIYCQYNLLSKSVKDIFSLDFLYYLTYNTSDRKKAFQDNLKQSAINLGGELCD